MRAVSGPSAKGLTVKAIAGTYVVLIAFNCDEDYCKDLLGFGIWRTDHTDNSGRWLPGLKRFDVKDPDDVTKVTTQCNPIQKFHWGDYTARSGRTYTYKVVAMRGSKTALVEDDSVEVVVTCEIPDRIGKNGHSVNFNRAAAASQAFVEHFPKLPKGDVTDPAARTWLSRGLQESLTKFIDDTQAGQGLHCFLYEFTKPEFADALKRALARGVRLEILHDGIIGNDGKGPSIDADPVVTQYGLDAVTKKRTGNGLAISHNKYMVRSDAAGTALAVWTGSTNFTDAGVYAQTNVGHAIAAPEPAGTYLKWHAEVWADPSKSASLSRTATHALTQVPAKPYTGTNPILSPRTTIEAIELCAELIGTADDIVCFTAPFALHDDLEKALIKAPAQVYGLLNKHNVVGKAMYDAPNTLLTAAAALSDASVLESWQAKMLAESLHHSGVFIHTKLILIDPLSDNPVTITGSANFSHNSSCDNDENQLFIFGEPEVADVYIGEFMRMFDHYYFRDHIKQIKAEAAANPKAAFLDETDAWTQRYFNGGEREKERLAFFKAKVLAPVG